MPVASDGPALVTVTVKATMSPTVGAVSSTAFVTDRLVTADGFVVAVAALSLASGSTSVPLTVAVLV